VVIVQFHLQLHKLLTPYHILFTVILPMTEPTVSTTEIFL